MLKIFLLDDISKDYKTIMYFFFTPALLFTQLRNFFFFNAKKIRSVFSYLQLKSTKYTFRFLLPHYSFFINTAIVIHKLKEPNFFFNQALARVQCN